VHQPGTRSTLVALRCFIIGLFIFSSQAALADFTSVSGSWTGQPFSNTAMVTMTVDVDLANPAFDLGPVSSYAHNWWYASGSFTNMNVTVTGSTNPLFNGVFHADAFGWVRVYSNASSPDQALTDPTNIADLGASYVVDYAPSDSGIGRLQVGVVNSTGGEYVASNSFVANVPEPQSLALAGLGITGLLLAGMRKRFLAARR
jgi:hypothetical protein